MRKEILLFVSLSACVLHFAGVPRQPHPQAVEGGDEMRLPPGAGDDWWGKVQADIRAEEYHITWQAPESGNRGTGYLFLTSHPHGGRLGDMVRLARVVWQGRFTSFPLDEAHLRKAGRKKMEGAE